jgi:hypothetical protein
LAARLLKEALAAYYFKLDAERNKNKGRFEKTAHAVKNPAGQPTHYENTQLYLLERVSQLVVN